MQILLEKHILIKFIYSEKATKFDKISQLTWNLLSKPQIKMEIYQIVFSEFLNFTVATRSNYFKDNIRWRMYPSFLKNGILLPKLFWPTVRKNCSSDRKRTFEIRGWRPRICKNFEITKIWIWGEGFFTL